MGWGGVITTCGPVLKGHSIRKVKNGWCSFSGSRASFACCAASLVSVLLSLPGDIPPQSPCPLHASAPLSSELPTGQVPPHWSLRGGGHLGGHSLGIPGTSFVEGVWVAEEEWGEGSRLPQSAAPLGVCERKCLERRKASSDAPSRASSWLLVIITHWPQLGLGSFSLLPVRSAS